MIARRGLRLAALCTMLAFAGCVARSGAGAPMGAMLDAIQKRERTLVLLRMAGDIDGKPLRPTRTPVMIGRAGVDTGGAFVFATGMLGLRPTLHLGTADAASERVRAAYVKYFTNESLEAGWFYLVLEPGTHYVALHAVTGSTVTSQMMQDAVRVRIDVPRDTPALYAGTLRLQLVGPADESRLRGFAPDAVQMQDETELANRELAKHAANVGAPRTALGERVQTGPVILRSPGR